MKVDSVSGVLHAYDIVYVAHSVYVYVYFMRYKYTSVYTLCVWACVCITPVTAENLSFADSEVIANVALSIVNNYELRKLVLEIVYGKNSWIGIVCFL